MLVAVTLVAVVLSLAYIYFSYHFSHWKNKGVHFVKPYPLVGSMLPVLTLREHMSEFFTRIYKQNTEQQLVGFFQGRTPALMIRDPEIGKHLLIRDFWHFSDHGLQFDKDADPLLAKNLFNMEGQSWKEMRSKLSPTFTSGRMKTMFPLVLQCAETLDNYLGKASDAGTFVNVKDLCARYTTNVIATSVFGVECDSINDPNAYFRVMGRQLFETDFIQGLKVAIISFLPEFTKFLHFTFFKKESTDYFRSLIGSVMALRTRTGEKRGDFLDMLFQLKNQGHLSPEEGEKDDEHLTHTNDKKLTDDEVMAQAMVFFIAGFETSSSALTFALFELSRRPDLQQRAREEIERVLQQHEGQLTYQALQDMNYLEWILMESLRKYPIISSIMRICTKEYVIPDTQITVAKGTQIHIPICAMQMDPQYFPEPDKFEPERFKDENLKNQFFNMPFGAGPRQCIGLRFAKIQSKLGLVSLLRKFEILPSPGLMDFLTWDPRQFLLNANEDVILEFIRHPL